MSSSRTGGRVDVGGSVSAVGTPGRACRWGGRVVATWAGGGVVGLLSGP
ncbi:MAG TPA: hypothetical protein VE196_07535 [Pseudonocardiaceae bacterium]|nr:hypothetical protein [Pseudonocardiaceae bacterium]